LTIFILLSLFIYPSSSTNAFPLTVLYYIPVLHCFSVCSLLYGVLSWYFTCKYIVLKVL
jgi:hypothetical protein